jgi:hypothetical protein
VTGFTVVVLVVALLFVVLGLVLFLMLLDAPLALDRLAFGTGLGRGWVAGSRLF